MYSLVRPLLFRLDPERAHHLTLKLLALPIAPLISPFFQVSNPKLRTSVFGLQFRNPVGLAAGYDKNGIAVRGLAALGFGHIEAGTVTRQPQSGNPLPRVFRLPLDEALINRMGFPNYGARPLTATVSRLGKYPAVLGINIGKGKDTPLENAADDYTHLLTLVAPHADYVAINISSPNTPGLRQLQTKIFVNDLLAQIAAVRATLDSALAERPILLKVAPDLSYPELDDILEAMLAHHFDGIIATNTTLSREGLLAQAPLRTETGGLSGKPLQARSTEMIRYIHRHTEGKLPIIGVGGIDSAQAALEKIRAGASLVQVYTGMIYKGPGLVKEINAGLLKAAGGGPVSELVGSESR
jgi:dihydroorotate dehydrogenase